MKGAIVSPNDLESRASWVSPGENIGFTVIE
jgi:hypothetical protein